MVASAIISTLSYVDKDLNSLRSSGTYWLCNDLLSVRHQAIISNDVVLFYIEQLGSVSSIYISIVPLIKNVYKMSSVKYSSFCSGLCMFTKMVNLSCGGTLLLDEIWNMFVCLFVSLSVWSCICLLVSTHFMLRYMNSSGKGNDIW